jgi:hypothetical protein
MINRVDGIDRELIEPERVFPVPESARRRDTRGRGRMSAKRRARIAHEIAAVHTAVLPRSLARAVSFAPAYAGFEAEASAIRAELHRAGVL